nr:unnamed protein product [Callosobruchus analis]
MESRQRNRVNKLIALIVEAILEEVDEEICVIKKKKLWVRKWIDRRNILGATNCLLKELALEDPKEYFDTLRMSESCVNFLPSKIHPQIQRKDTLLRSAIPAITKFGCSLRTLTHIFRLGKSTISEFIVEVCEAINGSLREFIKVSLNNYNRFIKKHLLRAIRSSRFLYQIIVTEASITILVVTIFV